MIKPARWLVVTHEDDIHRWGTEEGRLVLVGEKRLVYHGWPSVDAPPEEGLDEAILWIVPYGAEGYDPNVLAWVRGRLSDLYEWRLWGHPRGYIEPDAAGRRIDAWYVKPLPPVGIQWEWYSERKGRSPNTYHAKVRDLGTTIKGVLEGTPGTPIPAAFFQNMESAWQAARRERAERIGYAALQVCFPLFLALASEGVAAPAEAVQDATESLDAAKASWANAPEFAKAIKAAESMIGELAKGNTGPFRQAAAAVTDLLLGGGPAGGGVGT